jgi:glycosyltransferase involved in cell wall biosynthesis
MPAYNEEGAIADAVEDVRRHVFPLVACAELVVVDDGSRDATGRILDALAAAEARLRVIHQPNAGHGPALRRALDAARAPWLFLIDSDRQISLEEFAALWDLAREGDGAFGVRARRHDAPTRLLLTRVVRGAVRLLFGVRCSDLNVPFKIVRREVWLRAAGLIPPDTLAPSLFLAIISIRSGARIAFREVAHRRRATGKVSIRHLRLLRFCLRAFTQLLALRRRLGASRR